MEALMLAATLIVEVTAAAVIILKVFSRINKLMDGERCQLRTIMLETYYKHKDKKELHQYEFENFEKAYVAYKALNGNSFIDHVYTEVISWDLIR